MHTLNLHDGSVQSLSHVRLFVTAWTTARQASMSKSRSPPKPMSIESVMPSKHLILCRPLLLLPSIFPSIRVFSNESALLIRWPKYWSFSISPPDEYSGLIFFRIDWFDLLAVQGTLKSLLQHHSSLVLSLFYCPTLTSIHDYWKNHSFDYTDLCWQTNVSAFKFSVYVCHWFSSKEFSSVAQPCLTLCNSMYWKMPALPVRYQLPEFTQTHVHWVSDAIQLSHPLSSPSPALNLSQHQSLFQESVLHIGWPKYWSFSISPSNEYPGLISFRIVWFDLLAVQGTLKSLLQPHNLKASILWNLAFLMVRPSHPYMTTGKTITVTIRTFVGKVISLLFICCLDLSKLFF